MKRFLLFGGDTYYALGGFHDFVGSYDTYVGAFEVSEKMLSDMADDYRLDWTHIVDSKTGEMVYRSEVQAHGVD